MSRTRAPKLSESRIDYLTHVCNFMPGCERHCTVETEGHDCWADALVKRRPPKCELCRERMPHVHGDRLGAITAHKTPARIGMAFTGDLFADFDSLPLVGRHTTGATSRATLFECVLRTVQTAPWHRFVFLTRNPAGIPDLPWPDNCWFGTSVSFLSRQVAFRNYSEECRRLAQLQEHVRADRTWWSIEPCKGDWRIDTQIRPPACIVLGGQSGRGACGVDPDIVEGWQEFCRPERLGGFGIPLFVKRNARIPDAPQHLPFALMLPDELATEQE